MVKILRTEENKRVDESERKTEQTRDDLDELIDSVLQRQDLPRWYIAAIDSGRKWRKLNELALPAGIDPRTLEKEVLSPGSVRGKAGDQARKVLREANQKTERKP